MPAGFNSESAVGVISHVEAMKERILSEVRQFVGEAAPHDDMTLVVLKVVPEEAPA